MRAWLVACALLGLPGPLAAEPSTWRFIDPLIQQNLGIAQGEAPATFFTDHPDPASATIGLAFHYYESRSGGNSVGLSVGAFARGETGWVFRGPVQGLFGFDPRDAVFTQNRIEITTTVLKDGEPRCCPTGTARWAFDIASGQVTQISGP